MILRTILTFFVTFVCTSIAGIFILLTLARLGVFQAGLDLGMLLGGFLIVVAIGIGFIISLVVTTVFYMRSRDNEKP